MSGRSDLACQAAPLATLPTTVSCCCTGTPLSGPSSSLAMDEAFERATRALQRLPAAQHTEEMRQLAQCEQELRAAASLVPEAFAGQRASPAAAFKASCPRPSAAASCSRLWLSNAADQATLPLPVLCSSMWPTFWRWSAVHWRWALSCRRWKSSRRCCPT